MTAKELISQLEAVGWIKDRQKGSHAVYKHPQRNGRIIVPMHLGDLPKGTLNDILKKAGFETMIEYPIVLEKESDGRYSVYAPDLPGCSSWGATRADAINHIREAIEAWIESALKRCRTARPRCPDDR